MAIFLLILKIIGISLLSILGLVLLILLLVLFVPIRYRIKAEKGLGPKDIDVNVKVTWLLHFVNFLLTYKDKLFWRFRLAVFTLKSSVPKVKKEKKPKKTFRKRKEDVQGNIEELSSTDELEYTVDFNDDDEGNADTEDTVSNDALAVNEARVEQISAVTGDDGSESYEENKTDTDNDDSGEDNKSFFEKIKEFINAMYAFLNKIRSGALNVKDKLSDLVDNVDYYSAAISDERNKEAFSLCLKEIGGILNNIKPKVFKGRVHFGFEDPYTTGQVLAIFGMLIPILEDSILVQGDFEDEVLEGDLYIRGRVTVFVLVKAAFILYFNKDVKRMVKIYRRQE